MQKEERRSEGDGKKPKKRPYEKPRITFHEPMEGIAAVCPAPLKVIAPCVGANS